MTNPIEKAIYPIVKHIMRDKWKEEIDIYGKKIKIKTRGYIKRNR